MGAVRPRGRSYTVQPDLLTEPRQRQSEVLRSAIFRIESSSFIHALGICSGLRCSANARPEEDLERLLRKRRVANLLLMSMPWAPLAAQKKSHIFIVMPWEQGQGLTIKTHLFFISVHAQTTLSNFGGLIL